MKFAVLSLAIAFSPLSLAAQGAPSTGYSTYRIGGVSNGCPVSMKLEQSLSHQLQTVQNGKVVKSPATRLTLTLLRAIPSGGFGEVHIYSEQGNKQPASPSKPARILPRVAFDTATVHGFGTGPRFELLSPGAGRNARGNRAAAPQRNFKLQFNSKDGSSVSEMWLPGFGPVRWLDLNTITYTDGSTWKPAKGEMCTVTPSPFMLVGADSSPSQTNP
jgi:hypothetical protein